MRRAFAATMGVGAAVVGCAMMAGEVGAQLAPAPSISLFKRDGTTWTPAAVVCDSTNRDRVLVLSPPVRDRRVEMWSLAKPGLVASHVAVTLGTGDAGMNQVYYPFTDADGQQVGWVHALNPGIVEPGATTPAVTSIKLGQQTSNCRFAPQTRVLGATPRRSVQITATPTRGYRYRSYNYDTRLPEVQQPWGGRDTRASLTIDDGRLIERSGTRRVYQFENGGYTYRVFASLDPSHAGGGVQVSRSGRVVLAEPFGAYTAALQP